MNKKYELVKDDTIEVDGNTLYRIRALQTFGDADVEDGDLGGYIEREENLSEYGKSWVYGKSCVYDNAVVSGNAGVYDNARVSGNAIVHGNARVSCNASVSGYAIVSDNVRVSGNARVCGDARVYGESCVSGDSIATSVVMSCLFVRHLVTITDTHMSIGCEVHTYRHWKENIRDIGKRYSYNRKQINAVIHTINGLLNFKREYEREPYKL